MASFPPGMKRRLWRFLRQESLDLGEYRALADLAESFHMPRERLVSYSLSMAEGLADLQALDSDSIAAAVRSLEGRNLVRETDRDVLAQIRAYLAEDDALGPAFELPGRGELDLTLQGADLIARLEREVYGVRPEEHGLAVLRLAGSGRLEVFGVQKVAVARFFFDCVVPEHDRVVPGPMRRIGPWRERWWRRFPHGWRLCVQVRGKKKGDAIRTIIVEELHFRRLGGECK